MAVTGDPENRHGIILAKNQLAKKYNINTAETIWMAKQKCPALVCVLAHHGLYSEISDKINQIYLEYTDLVEPASIDESYLDVTNSLHLFDLTPKELADLLRIRIKNEIGVSISVGVSFCKSVAKFGSDYKKPDATTVIMRDDLPLIYWKAPVSDMLMAGKKTTDKLKNCGIRTIGDLALADRAFLESHFGKMGTLLYDTANGMEKEPVASFFAEREVKSIGNSMTFRRDLLGKNEIRSGLSALSDSVAVRLRKAGKKCSVVQIAVRDPEFKTVQKQKSLSKPTNLQKEITEIAFALFGSCCSFEMPVRLLSVTASGLTDEDEEFCQLDMFFTEKQASEKQAAIEDTIDSIRDKYGKHSIAFGHFKNSETGIK